mmetsp:Transcript_4395/g.12147  ORF Transcript_4395/g.12147 Transcript_4395/m.12147 type:complete len:83 (+) Transcript_4395:1440-1688(+)
MLMLQIPGADLLFTAFHSVGLESKKNPFTPASPRLYVTGTNRSPPSEHPTNRTPSEYTSFKIGTPTDTAAEDKRRLDPSTKT